MKKFVTPMITSAIAIGCAFALHGCSKSSSNAPAKATVNLQPLFSTLGKDMVYWTNTKATLYYGDNRTQPS